MKIRLLSDLHQEFYEDSSLYQTQGEDVLILAGDIHVGLHQTSKALKKFHAQQKNIIYLPGNHEYYRTTIDAFDAAIGIFTRDCGIHYLNPGMVRIGSVTFICATLWTNFQNNKVAKFACARGINDFSSIKGFDTDACALLHEQHISYIKNAISATAGTKVVVTHFLPAVECIEDQYRGPDPLNCYFANDYADYISTLKDTTWLFGHTHSNIDVTIGTTRLISNPYGYNRNHNYQELVLEID